MVAYCDGLQCVPSELTLQMGFNHLLWMLCLFGNSLCLFGHHAPSPFWTRTGVITPASPRQSDHKAWWKSGEAGAAKASGSWKKKSHSYKCDVSTFYRHLISIKKKLQNSRRLVRQLVGVFQGKSSEILYMPSGLPDSFRLGHCKI